MKDSWHEGSERQIRFTGDATLARDAKLLKDTVREAGALALSLFRTDLKN